MEIPVLFVGQAERGEFRRVLAQLHTVSRMITAPDLPAAHAVLSQHPSIRRILLAPLYRDEFPAGALDQLVGRQPLAEIFMLVGPWLEGETRSGHPWLAAQRLYLHQLVPWLRCSPPDSGRTTPPRSPWRPATLHADEAWQLAAAAPWPRPTGRVVLCGELPESRQSLAAVCTAAGLRFVAHGPQPQVECADVDAVVYEAVSDRTRWESQIRQLAESYRPRALVVLMNFPRPDECAWMLRCGATEVLGKPFQVDHLLASLVVPADTAGRCVA